VEGLLNESATVQFPELGISPTTNVTLVEEIMMQEADVTAQTVVEQL